jgi:hypothetical protein
VAPKLGVGGRRPSRAFLAEIDEQDVSMYDLHRISTEPGGHVTPLPDVDLIDASVDDRTGVMRKICELIGFFKKM